VDVTTIKRSNPETIRSPWLQQKHGGSRREWRPTSKLQVGLWTSKEVLPEDFPLSVQFCLPKCINHI
jgi:hypothetical protein